MKKIKKCSHCGKKVSDNNYVSHETVGLNDVVFFHRRCFSKVYGFETVRAFALWMEEKGK